MLTKERLQGMNEAQLRKEVLIPLLKKMGYQDVKEYHGGAGEQGKDIVCWDTDKLGIRRNQALVVKAVNITGRANAARGTATEVLTQISQCFGKPFQDIITGEEQRVHECWVVSNHEILKEAIDTISSSLSTHGLVRDVRFVNGDSLWKLIETYLPTQAVWEKLHEASEVFGTLDSHYSLQSMVSDTGIQITASEKYPGASQEKPIRVKSSFVFPDTPEGQEVQNAFEKFRATGSPVEIPSSFIQNIELPEFLQEILGPMTKNGSLKFGSTSMQQAISFPARIEFDCDDGDKFALEYIYFKVVQAGQSEVTLANDNQPTHIHVQLILSLKDNEFNITFETHASSLNIKQVLDDLKLQACLSKPCSIEIIQLDTGIPLCGAKHQGTSGDIPSSMFIKVVEGLYMLQVKTRQPITIPLRELTEDEEDTLKQLYAIFSEGRITGTWDTATIKVSASLEHVNQLLNDLDSGQTNVFFVEQEKVVSLFDVELPLGRARTICSGAKLTNEQEIREKLVYAKDSSKGTDLNLVYEAATDANAVEEYLDWLPNLTQSTDDETRSL